MSRPKSQDWGSYSQGAKAPSVSPLGAARGSAPGSPVGRAVTQACVSPPSFLSIFPSVYLEAASLGEGGTSPAGGQPRGAVPPARPSGPARECRVPGCLHQTAAAPSRPRTPPPPLLRKPHSPSSPELVCLSKFPGSVSDPVVYPITKLKN